jgi:aryl-alcohol dehydrogenase-like predicted oxidoreductase
MDYRHLGRTGLKVSPLCLGTMYLGPETSEPDSHAIMDRALELGINYFDTADVYGWKKEAHRSQLEAYEGLCRDVGQSPAEVALAWLLHRPVVTAPIIGPRTGEQLESAMRAVDISLSDDILSRLDEIWPGPGGPAPEAYAW